MTKKELYYQLVLENEYTQDFDHQYLVDIFCCETYAPETKPISIAFALVGLYLFLEKDFSWKLIQNFHKHLSKQNIILPQISIHIKNPEFLIEDMIKLPINERKQKFKFRASQVRNIYSQDDKNNIKLLTEKYLTNF